MMSLPSYLSSHAAQDSNEATHTRMPDPSRHIYGGKFKIEDQDLGQFFQIYYKHVFGPNPQPEYLTERQRDIGPLVIDLDFRYKENRRVYNGQLIEAFIGLVFEELQRLLTEISTDIDVYVMEKPRVNDTDPKVIKDGLHFLFGLNLDKTLKDMLRMRLLSRMDQIWSDIKDNLSNNWDSVIDRNVMIAAGTNWMLYGSRKPGFDVYVVTAYYTGTIELGAPLITKRPTPVITASLLPKLSVRYQDYETFDNLRDIYHAEYDNLRSGATRPSTHRVVDRSVIGAGVAEDLSSEEKVDQALARLFDDIGMARNDLKEAHDFAMVLPESYYGPSSYNNWIRVGFCLKNTDPRMFPSWVKVSSRSSTFTYSKVPEFLKLWNGMEPKDNSKMLTSRSLAYYAKRDNLAGYEEVMRGSADRILDEILRGPAATEYDLAFLLYTMFKDKFVCISIKNKIWYAFENHRWVETDTGSNLRKQLSETVYLLFAKKLTATMSLSPDEKEASEVQRQRVKKISTIMMDLKNHTKKSNIMKEAADQFFVKGFMDKIDSKPHLIGCANGVVDFGRGIIKERKQRGGAAEAKEAEPSGEEDVDEDTRDSFVFRPGRPEDYICKSTCIDYIPVTEEHAEIVAEIKEFFCQLFPEPSLRTYMWDHMASLLIGKNINQTFNIYTGIGRNGKSVFADLISQVLGEYQATVPVSIVTCKRVGVGASSSEVAQLQGIRFAMMQEPSKGDKINEGPMKEMTGGDKLQARALFKDSVTFPVLFKLVMCANELPEIKVQDEGTWRRIRICPFKSYFCDDPAMLTKPFHFLVDKNINYKFKKWRTVLFAMLVKRAFATGGHVEDCDIVTAASREYRDNQDILSDFLKCNLTKEVGSTELVSDVFVQFKCWWTKKNPPPTKEKMPSEKELSNYMGRHHYETNVAVDKRQLRWLNVKMIVEEVPVDDPDA